MRKRKVIIFNFIDGAREVYSEKKIEAYDDTGSLHMQLINIRNEVILPALEKGKPVIFWKGKTEKILNPLTLKSVDFKIE